MPKRVLAAGLFIATALAALTPIRSYDFFWHLATGRWIVEHRALPLTDPFALASANTPWINGEWLWEIGAYAAHAVGGERGISIAQALFVAAIFVIGFLFAARDRDVGLALLASALAFAGASDRLGVRPAAAAAMLIAIAVGLLGQARLPVLQLSCWYVLLTIIWINVHPSALLAPVLAACTLLIDVRRWIVVVASAGALLVNPFGWNAIVAPLHLSAAASSGAFVNSEWLVSPVTIFPLLYLTIAAIVIASFIARQDLWRIAIFVLLAALAIRYVRNQGLYFAALPMLVPPLKVSRKASIALAACALVPIGWVLLRFDHTLGTDGRYFPVRAVARLQSLALPGNIYDADQFGGYLIWNFYPQRRVVTDGRNELYSAFLAEDARAHRDSRAWHALLAKYRVDLAVDEYAPPMPVLDVATRQVRLMPASLVRYPRKSWALIAYDGTAMVFARRAAFPPELLAKIESVGAVPDAR